MESCVCEGAFVPRKQELEERRKQEEFKRMEALRVAEARLRHALDLLNLRVETGSRGDGSGGADEARGASLP